MQTEKRINLEFLKQNNIHFIISSGYAPIIKKDIISLYPNKIINIHISYLPYGKGIYPNLWTVFEGNPSGVSIHGIDEGIDTGYIIARKRIYFDNEKDTLKTSHNKLLKEAELLFFKYWNTILSGKYYAINQEELSKENHYRNRKESEKLLTRFPKRWDTLLKDIR